MQKGPSLLTAQKACKSCQHRLLWCRVGWGASHRTNAAINATTVYAFDATAGEL